MKVTYAELKDGQKVLVLPDLSVWEIDPDGQISQAQMFMKGDIKYTLDVGANNTDETVSGEFYFSPVGD